MPQLSARRISGDLVEYLADSKPHPARVHSLFTRAFNLKVADGCLVSGTNSRGYIAPMGFSFQSLLTSGWPFSLDQELILHPGGVCSASGELLIDFSNAAIWNPSLATIFLPLEKQERSLQLLTRILEGSQNGIFTPLLPGIFGEELPSDLPLHAAFIARRVFSFLGHLANSEWQAAALDSEGLIGFGSGLTPSADDFLAAILGLYTALPLDEKENKAGFSLVAERILELAPARTSLVSAEMLRHAANGRLPSPHQSLLAALDSGSVFEVEEAARAVLNVGVNSGGDFLFGLLAGLVLMAEPKLVLCDQIKEIDQC